MYNIEDTPRASITDDKIDFDPQAEFEENQPTFDEPLINV